MPLTKNCLKIIKNQNDILARRKNLILQKTIIKSLTLDWNFSQTTIYIKLIYLIKGNDVYIYKLQYIKSLVNVWLP